MPAAILYDNLADTATVTASSWVAAAPPATLQNEHVSRRWKGRLGASEYVLVDLGAATAIDTIALLGCQAIVGDTQANMTAAATTRVRVSTADAMGLAGDAYDSGLAAGRVRAAYGALVVHRPAPVTGRYVRIDLAQASAEAILAGRLVIGLRSAFAVNFGYGWSYGYADLSRTKKSAGGQTYIERDDRYRVLNLNFEFVDPAERYGFVDEIDRINGLSRDILFVIDPASSEPDRDTLWGLMTDLSPPTEPYLNLFSKSYRIEERR